MADLTLDTKDARPYWNSLEAIRFAFIHKNLYPSGVLEVPVATRSPPRLMVYLDASDLYLIGIQGAGTTVFYFSGRPPSSNLQALLAGKNFVAMKWSGNHPSLATAANRDFTYQDIQTITQTLPRCSTWEGIDGISQRQRSVSLLVCVLCEAVRFNSVARSFQAIMPPVATLKSVNGQWISDKAQNWQKGCDQKDPDIAVCK